MKKVSYFSHAKEILSLYLHNFLREQKKVRYHPNIESVHRMRVASRRLRSAIHVFQCLGLLPFQQAQQAKKQIAKIGRALGPARQLDVQLKFLLSIKKTFYKNGFIELSALLKTDRKEAQKDINHSLVLLQKNKKLIKIKSLLQNKISSEVVLLQKRLILKQLNKLFLYNKEIHNANQEEKLHTTRIAAKKLRYTLEIVEPFYGKKINPSIKAARQIQNILGDVHELDVWLKYLQHLSRQRNKSRHLEKTLLYLKEFCLILREKAYKKFIKTWITLRQKNTWKKLEKII